MISAKDEGGRESLRDLSRNRGLNQWESVMMRTLLSFLAMVMLSGAMASPAAAGPKPGTCSGTLSRLPEGEWVIRTGREGMRR
jgi:hypothetical protein